MNARHCDMCLIREKPGEPVLQFSLIQTIHTPKATTRGAGSLMLCGRCWSKYAQPRMRAARERARKKAARESMKRLAAVGVEVAA